MKITSIRKYEQLKIYFNGLLHLHLKLNDLVGIQSWIHGEKEYYIEYTFKEGKVTSAYEDRGRWEEVLAILDKDITVIG